MSKSITEVTGFKELQKQIGRLGNDRLKRNEMLKILRQSSKATLQAARSEVPVSKKEHLISGKRTRRVIQPGNLRKSIGNITGKSKVIPTIYVGPRVKGKQLGFYGAFVHGGTIKGIKPNPYLTRAYNKTKGQVTAEAEKGVAKYVQKQINKLSNA